MTRQRGNEDDEHERHVQPTPALSLLSLPDLAHDAIASFLQDDDDDEDNSCLRAAEVSCDLLEFYWGTLTEAYIRYDEGYSAARLAAFLQRQKKLVEVIVDGQEGTITAFSQAIMQGCCRQIEEVRLWGETSITQEGLDLLVGALAMGQVLPALRTLVVDCGETPGTLPKVATALARGFSPLLEDLSLYWGDESENDRGLIADMLEARASNPGCKGLACFEGNGGWLDQATLAIQIRLLRTLLPSIKKLPALWRSAFAPCFLDVRAPYLTCLNVWIEDDGSVFSWDVFAAAPALEKIQVAPSDDLYFHAAAMHSVTVALRHGALQKLQEVEFDGCLLGDVDLRDFIGTLERSGCAQRLVALTLSSCEIGAQGIGCLTDLLCRDAFPALDRLRLSNNPSISDKIVMALAEDLLKAKHTYFKVLDLDDVGMGDEGIAALAHLVHQGRLEQLGYFGISDNNAATDRGAIALAQAIDAHGLPKVQCFLMRNIEKLTGEGISAIMQALTKGCPRDAYICFG